MNGWGTRTSAHRSIEENRMNSTEMLFKNLLSDESGQDLIEYALIAALLALAAIGAMNSLAGKIQSTFSSIGSSL
jgi:pilus assembly protein Flp/PilA